MEPRCDMNNYFFLLIYYSCTILMEYRTTINIINVPKNNYGIDRVCRNDNWVLVIQSDTGINNRNLFNSNLEP